MFASETQLKQMEDIIAAIEAASPCEVRMVVDKTGGQYALGGLRICVVALGLFEWLAHYWWLNLPTFLFYFPLFLTLLTPTHILAAVPGGRFLATRREKHDELRRRAEHYFQLADLHKTEGRNAVLLYFSTPERLFYFLTDSGLIYSWPQNLWQVYAEQLASGLRTGTTGDALLRLLAAIKTDAVKYLGPRALPKKQNELSDKVVII